MVQTLNPSLGLGNLHLSFNPPGSIQWQMRPVPQGQLIIARRFNAGMSAHYNESHRDG